MRKICDRIDIVMWLREVGVKTKSLNCVLVASTLGECMNWSNGKCNPSRKYISDATDILPANVSRAISTLKKHGYISEEKINGRAKSWSLYTNQNGGRNKSQKDQNETEKVSQNDVANVNRGITGDTSEVSRVIPKKVYRGITGDTSEVSRVIPRTMNLTLDNNFTPPTPPKILVYNSDVNDGLPPLATLSPPAGGDEEEVLKKPSTRKRKSRKRSGPRYTRAEIESRMARIEREREEIEEIFRNRDERA